MNMNLKKRITGLLDIIFWHIGKLYRLQFWYLITKKSPKFLSAIFVLISSTISMIIMGIAAHFTSWAQIFPALGPTTFLIFYAPSKAMASPKNCIIGHLLGAIVGTSLFMLLKWFSPESILKGVYYSGLSISEILIIAISMGITGLLMVLSDLLHPPAASTAMLAAMGLYVTTWYEIPVFLMALLLLILIGICMHKLAGINYPIWSLDDNEELAITTKLGEIKIKEQKAPQHVSEEGVFYKELSQKLVCRQFDISEEEIND